MNLKNKTLFNQHGWVFSIVS